MVGTNCILLSVKFLFHGTEEGTSANATMFCIVGTAKANERNVFQYLYTLLLYTRTLDLSAHIYITQNKVVEKKKKNNI